MMIGCEFDRSVEASFDRNILHFMFVLFRVNRGHIDRSDNDFTQSGTISVMLLMIRFILDDIVFVLSLNLRAKVAIGLQKFFLRRFQNNTFAVVHLLLSLKFFKFK